MKSTSLLSIISATLTNCCCPNWLALINYANCSGRERKNAGHCSATYRTWSSRGRERGDMGNKIWTLAHTSKIESATFSVPSWGKTIAETVANINNIIKSLLIVAAATGALNLALSPVQYEAILLLLLKHADYALSTKWTFAEIALLLLWSLTDCGRSSCFSSFSLAPLAPSIFSTTATVLGAAYLLNKPKRCSLPAVY